MATTTSSSSKPNNHALHERSPLLLSTASTLSSFPEESSSRPQALPSASPSSAASVTETMTNLAKTCCGTGILALPYAAQQGGLLLFGVGIIAVALWNVIASKRLCDCWELLETLGITQHNEEEAFSSSGINASEGHDPMDVERLNTSYTPTPKHYHKAPPPPPPPPGTATLGKVAWYAWGPSGLMVLDIMTVILLMGILVAYNDAIRMFLQETPCTTHNDVIDAVLVASMIAPLAVVPDMGYLTKTSAAGLSVLGMALLVIAGYGIQTHYVSETSSFTSPSPLPWFPRDGLTGVSHWFGCTVFGFGIVPLTFNFQESMAEPARYPNAALFAVLLVAALYALVGISMLVLYPDIDTQVMSELPQTGVLPAVTRLAMVVVVMATAPLLIVPCAELIEGKLPQLQTSSNGMGTLTSDKTQREQEERQTQRRRILVRFGICFVAVGISVGVPGFVTVLTFVGCFCVAFVSFCIPPSLHLVLLLKYNNVNKSEWRHWDRRMWLDICLLTWGLTATCISTTYVFRQQQEPNVHVAVSNSG